MVENLLIIEDVLIIMGKGLGLFDIVVNLLYVLVILIFING